MAPRIRQPAGVVGDKRLATCGLGFIVRLSCSRYCRRVVAGILKAHPDNAANKVPTTPAPRWLMRVAALRNPGLTLAQEYVTI